MLGGEGAGAVALGEVDGGEGGEDEEAAAELFAGFGEEAVEEFEVAALQPERGAADGAAGEVEDGADADDDAARQVRRQAAGKLLLLGRAECYPDDVRRAELCQAGGDGGVVELLCRAVGEREVGRGGELRAAGGEGLAQGGEGALAAAEEGHGVGAAAYEIAKELRAAVLRAPYAVEPTQVERHPRAIADGEDGARYGAAVFGIPVDHGEYVAICHADVARLPRAHGFCNALLHGGGGKLVADVEKAFLHWE